MQMFHQSSLKMGLDQAVLQGIEGGTGDGEGVLSKEEVERLLRHGAYDIFNEEKSGSSEQESKEFESQDIDSILARRAKTVVHDNTGSNSNAAGGTFSKASFRAQNTGKSGDGTGNGDDTGEDVDIDDPGAHCMIFLLRISFAHFIFFCTKAVSLLTSYFHFFVSSVPRLLEEDGRRGSSR